MNPPRKRAAAKKTAARKRTPAKKAEPESKSVATSEKKAGKWGDVWLTVKFANIGRDKSPAVRKRALQKLHDEKGENGLTGFAEIDEGDTGNETKMVREIFAEHQLLGLGSRVPMAIPAWWDVVSHRILRASPGISRVSPPRVVDEALIQLRGVQVAVLVVHFISGAFNHKEDRAERLRRTYWFRNWYLLVRVAMYWRLRGVTVVVMGDFNRSGRVPKLHHSEIEFEHGLDSIKVLPGRGVTVTMTDHGTFDLPVESKHDALWASLHIVKGAT